MSEIKESCELETARIAKEKLAAEEDLAQAKPFLEEAEKAIDSIKPADMQELKKLPNPSDIIKLVFDCVLLLKMAKMQPVGPADVILGIGKAKKKIPFIRHSFANAKTGLLQKTNFLQILLQFSNYEKDNINEETVELMSPYLNLPNFEPKVARNASRACEGLCTWVRAMIQYHDASKVVKPKLEALNEAAARLAHAEKQLRLAEQRLKNCREVMEGLQGAFEKQMQEKTRIAQSAQATRDRMHKATMLITDLADEQERWTNDKEVFKLYMRDLAGNCAYVASFLAYCGPFNKSHRAKLMSQFTEAIRSRKIPRNIPGEEPQQQKKEAKRAKSKSKIKASKGGAKDGKDATETTEATAKKTKVEQFSLENFLLRLGKTQEWALHKLPLDERSIQNAILSTQTSRYPLLVDPQGQGLDWLLRELKDELPDFGETTKADHPKLADRLEVAMAQGKAFIVTVEENINVLLREVLNKDITLKGQTYYMQLGDKTYPLEPSFRLYLVTRLPNPSFTPEVQAMATLVDFTVTQEGLEDQLLGLVIQQEQAELERQLTQATASVAANTLALVDLNAKLLSRLTSVTGNLLDDNELINVLSQTKTKHAEVKKKLTNAAAARTEIRSKREIFRAVARRGAVLYFSIVEIININPMYETSLDRFLTLFTRSMQRAEKAQIKWRRAHNIVAELTYTVYRYINRGLYVSNKLCFLLIMLFKILVTGGRIQNADVITFIRCGALCNESMSQCPYNWMSRSQWRNIVAMSRRVHFFRGLCSEINQAEAEWQKWINCKAPEATAVPFYEGDLQKFLEYGAFMRTLLVRAVREDRATIAVKNVIHYVQRLAPEENAASDGLPALGPKFVAPVTDTLNDCYLDSDNVTPILFLLSAGTDPTEMVINLSRKQRRKVEVVSMGEGQETPAIAAFKQCAQTGNWVLLQNCHLCTDFMSRLESLLLFYANNTATGAATGSGLHERFRLFLTAETNRDFPINLLQRSVKFTCEAPRGMCASMMSSFSSTVDQEKLERLDDPRWRQLIYTTCFLHSAVIERRKYGAIGWSIPYEFNTSDLQVSLAFLEKHMYSELNFQAIRYMIGSVHYGGKITDLWDRELFQQMVENWVGRSTLSGSFAFNPPELLETTPGEEEFQYTVPKLTDLEAYRTFISEFPSTNSPELLGLHPNADLSFMIKETRELINNVAIAALPNSTNAEAEKAAAATTTATKEVAMSRDMVVLKTAQDVMSRLPPKPFVLEDCRQQIEDAHGGMAIAMNVFLLYEIKQMRKVHVLVRSLLKRVMQALRGEIAVTPALAKVTQEVFEGQAPRDFVFDAVGEEVSWRALSLSGWVDTFIKRREQLGNWLEKAPTSFWFGGFFNPRGFLTAIRQGVSRKQDKRRELPLDKMVLDTEVTEFSSVESIVGSATNGAFIHGLVLDGASWSSADQTLVECLPKVLRFDMPILHVMCVTTVQKRNKTGEYGPYGAYECPCYRYPQRTQDFFVFSVDLGSRQHRPSHWMLRGVALLIWSDLE